MKKDDRLAVLLESSLFAGIALDELQRLLNSNDAAILRYGRNQLVYLQGEVCQTLDIVLAGKISVQRVDAEGNVLRIEDFRRGSIIGANLIFAASSEYPLAIVSEEETTLLSIGAPLILQLCKKNELFTLNLLRAVSDRTLVLASRIDEISPSTLREKILVYLAYQVNQQGNSTIRLDGTKKQLAERLGVRRTSLSRELHKMKDEGLLDYDRETITLLYAGCGSCFER